MFKKLFSLFEGVCSWCVGFLVAGFIFAIAIFHIVPVAAKIPVDTSKYIVRAHGNIEETQNPLTTKALGDEKEELSLSDTLIHEIDKAADDLIYWINQKPK